jgi:hypothetical protein
MFEYEYDYNRVLEDTDELYDYDDYDYIYNQEVEYENYYHTVADEICDD